MSRFGPDPLMKSAVYFGGGWLLGSFLNGAGERGALLGPPLVSGEANELQFWFAASGLGVTFLMGNAPLNWEPTTTDMYTFWLGMLGQVVVNPNPSQIV